ncbi:Condensin complex subunit 2 [Arabidopsis thaliana]|uniref:Condensin complex subunit 2 n=3 Tax=Arabidopsis TaxID=3701 RepID=A0A178VRH6_ARATH|nr:Condensin complex subunit 2/barren [Arabidopsis thaliana x Arabidopsis arenosa]KAG7642858.1 Condensin complex subunit 2/barren [Arabidopsis suecica]OAP09050.1 EMB2795 [Arabidopsis thaliana]
MDESLTPNPKQKPASTTTRIQAPTSPFFLGSNDDRLEREQARAARAAASRRRSVIFARGSQPETESDPCFDKQQILELFQNCIKLASENKINQKNTWELNLIDHLCEIIKVEDENNTETNFQKASCTLEAGVKIYSMRVDSVHSEAYKVLGGITRAGHDDGGDHEDAAGAVENATNQNKQPEKKISPLSTLEPSFDGLNVKKFDVAFAVDPLYHQTSAQFDEGGAKGLLLNNLGVYGGCQVLFDSQEIPGKLVLSANKLDKSETIDLSFAEDCVEQMVLNMRKKDEIVPSLRAIINQFDEANQRPSDTFSCGQQTTESFDISHANDASYADDDEGYENFGTSFDYEGQSGDVDENFGPNDAEPTYSNFHEEDEPASLQDMDSDDRLENVDDYLFLSLGISSKQNSWAGPDHWKYRKTKGPDVQSASENKSSPPAKKTRKKKQAEPELDFAKALEEEMPDIFAPPKNPKTLLLPASRTPCQTKLPEDCHYQPENLIKLFLLPNVMCLGRRRRKNSGETSRQQHDDYEHGESWGNDNVYDDDDGPFDDNGNDQSDAEDTNTLISQPRQVNKIDVQYDKASKQVDVQVLKETLWECLQESHQPPIQDEEHQQEPPESRSFKVLLASFPDDCQAAERTQDISPHLCFICLLHLANEHNLSLIGSQNLDDLTIHLA